MKRFAKSVASMAIAVAVLTLAVGPTTLAQVRYSVKNYFAMSRVGGDNALHIGGTFVGDSGGTIDLGSATVKVPLGGAGTATAGTAVAGLSDSTSNTSGSVQSTEYALNTVTLPASALNANGRGIRCDAWGLTAANANAKNFKFYVGSTAVVTVTGSTASAKDYQAELTLVRTGSNTQSAHAQIQIDTAVAPSMAQSTTVGQTDTSQIAITLKAANTAAAATSGTGNGMICSFLN